MVVAYDETVSLLTSLIGWSVAGPGTASLLEIVNEGLSRLVHKLQG